MFVSSSLHTEIFDYVKEMVKLYNKMTNTNHHFSIRSAYIDQVCESFVVFVIANKVDVEDFENDLEIVLNWVNENIHTISSNA